MTRTITASVKTKLAAEKPATLTKVDVDTNKGTVYLTGNVENRDHQGAGDGARAAGGRRPRGRQQPEDPVARVGDGRPSRPEWPGGPAGARVHGEEVRTRDDLLLILLILLLVGALPTWPYSSGWGYYPSGALGLVLIVLLILFLTGRL